MSVLQEDKPILGENRYSWYESIFYMVFDKPAVFQHSSVLPVLSSLPDVSSAHCYDVGHSQTSLWTAPWKES